jgi:Uma2 family endonuclease
MGWLSVYPILRRAAAGGRAMSLHRDVDRTARPRLNDTTMGLAVRRRRFTVEEYRRMGETGILADDPRIELIAGSIVVREPTGSRHAGMVDRIGHLFFARLAGRAVVRIQNPVSFPGEMSELQPDLMLLRPRADFYVGGHPGAAAVLLLIEVTDSTLRLDRRVKIPLYARAGIAEAWLLDPPASTSSCSASLA